MVSKSFSSDLLVSPRAVHLEVLNAVDEVISAQIPLFDRRPIVGPCGKRYSNCVYALLDYLYFTMFTYMFTYIYTYILLLFYVIILMIAYHMQRIVM